MHGCRLDRLPRMGIVKAWRVSCRGTKSAHSSRPRTPTARGFRRCTTAPSEPAAASRTSAAPSSVASARSRRSPCWRRCRRWLPERSRGSGFCRPAGFTPRRPGTTAPPSSTPGCSRPSGGGASGRRSRRDASPTSPSTRPTAAPGTSRPPPGTSGRPRTRAQPGRQSSTTTGRTPSGPSRSTRTTISPSGWAPARTTASARWDTATASTSRSTGGARSRTWDSRPPSTSA